MRRLSALVALAWFAVPALSADATLIEVTWSYEFPTIQTTGGGVFEIDLDAGLVARSYPFTVQTPYGSQSGTTSPAVIFRHPDYFPFNAGFESISFAGGGLDVPCPAPGACPVDPIPTLSVIEISGLAAMTQLLVPQLGGPALLFTFTSPIAFQTRAIPEPATAWLLAGALAGVGLWRRRGRR